MNVKFKHIEQPFVRDCFLEALRGFPELADHEIILQQRSVATTNMRAQPQLDFRFFRRARRAYKIEISNHPNFAQYLNLTDLPAKVLIGWIAHELGHVMDYRERSAWDMIKFALGYWFFANFRVGAERKADIYAIEQGFAAEVMVTKKYILEHSDLPNRYKARIDKYYLSPEEVAMMIDQSDDDLIIDRAL
jgi:hypothetical protein